MSLRGVGGNNGTGSSSGVLKIDVKKGQVAGIALGDYIGKVLAYIQLNYQTYGRIDIISQKEDVKQPILIVLPDSGLKLKFDAKHQILELIELFLLPSQESKKRMVYTMKDQPLVPQLMNYATLSQNQGPTYPPRIIGNSVLLSYTQQEENNVNGMPFNVSFVFMYNERDYKDSSKDLTLDQLMAKENSLVKINIQRDQQDASSPKERKGIEISFQHDHSKEPILLLFGDHLMDVLRLLGNPNKEYQHEGNLFLNYLELGFDLMITEDYTLKKFILHTNFPQHPHFGFYNRCFYELQMGHFANSGEGKIFGSSGSGGHNHSNNNNEEMKESFFSNNNDQSMMSQNRVIDSYQQQQQQKSQKKKKTKGQSKQDKNNLSLLSPKDSPQFYQQHNIGKDSQQTITPLTKFSFIKDLFSQEQKEDANHSSKDQQQQFYVRNLTNDFTTHYHAYRSIIFEVMVGEQGGDYVASVTLFKV